MGREGGNPRKTIPDWRGMDGWMDDWAVGWLVGRVGGADANVAAARWHRALIEQDRRAERRGRIEKAVRRPALGTAQRP